MMKSDMLDEGNEEIWSLEATSLVHSSTQALSFLPSAVFA